MTQTQPGILAPVPALARFLTFSLAPGADPAAALADLAVLSDGESVVVGLGPSLVASLGAKIDGLRPFPVLDQMEIDIPSTPASLWCWLRGEDRGELVHQARAIHAALAPAFVPTEVVDAFQYGMGFDLTGYEDGTENPTDAEAIAAAVVAGRGEGLDGSSFVTVQRWLHDLDAFEAMSQPERDHTFGRRQRDNEELEDAPPSAHVKRTAQEDFDPAAFVLRRSMPWADELDAGLVFVAFGKSFDAYEALLSRMVGLDDGITDALFRFTQPLTGCYFWCPPVRDGRLDLRALGL